jgi:membrane peptidoglycan carboxypeptidase
LSDDLGNLFRISEPGGETRIVYTHHPEQLVPATPLPITPAWLMEKEVTADLEKEVWIDNMIPAGILDTLENHIQKSYRKLLTDERYSLEVLANIKDFRTLVNLSFVTYLSKKIGISTPLDPVLSFPLGPNSISIMEAALAYDTLITGKRYPLSSEEDATMVPIITKIVDREGEVIYAYNPEPKRVLPEKVSALTTEILRKVMEVGTGRKARDAVRMFDIPIPTFGKTGTANRFTNSSFVGFIPGRDVVNNLFDMDDGYAIAAYAGYDDNRPMKGKHTEIYGSSGALPLWIDTANAIIDAPDFKEGIEPADLIFSGPLVGPEAKEDGFCSVQVSAVTGLPLRPRGTHDSSPGTEVLTQAEDLKGTWKLKRTFEPF